MTVVDVFQRDHVGLKLRLRFSWLRPDFITERNVQAWLDGSKSAIQTQIQRVFLFNVLPSGYGFTRPGLRHANCTLRGSQNVWTRLVRIGMTAKSKTYLLSTATEFINSRLRSRGGYEFRVNVGIQTIQSYFADCIGVAIHVEIIVDDRSQDYDDMFQFSRQALLIL